MATPEESNVELLAYRVKRLYAGLAHTAPTSIEEFPPSVTRDGKLIVIMQDFRGGETEDEIRERLLQIVDHIAHLKDPLKKFVDKRGQDAKLVEMHIDSSRALQLIVDLENREKHGYPPDHPSRSGLDLYLDEVGRSMQMRSGPRKGSYIVYRIDPETGRPTMRASAGASAPVVYWGQVRERNGKTVGDVLDLSKRAIEDWERLFSTLGICFS